MFSTMRRLPAHVINGITVAAGIGLVQLVATLLFDARVASLASTGAIYASLPHLAVRTAHTWKRVLAGGVIGSLVAAPMLVLRAHPGALGPAIALLAFAALMAMAWGQRAGPVSFAAVLSIVLSMALPAGLSVVELLMASLLGAVVYLAWAVASNKLLEPRYRTLAVASSVRAAAQLLRTRARVLVEPALEPSPSPAPAGELASSRLGWIGDEASLAELLQAARDLAFTAADTPRARRESAVLLHTIDLRDTLLASRLDLDLLGDDATAQDLRGRLAKALDAMASALDTAHVALRDGTAVRRDPDDDLHRDVTRVFADAAIDASDARTRLLPAIVGRLTHLADDVGHILALLRGSRDDAALSAAELGRFVPEEGWPLATLAAHLSPASPVFRHAVRTGIALATAYFLSRLLPWTSHSYWLVLSIAVVLRGTLEQTLSRRNARILGTAIGCVIVAALARAASESAMHVAFLASVGAAHAFVTVRYVLTASAATVMALLQAHLVAPATGFAIVERLADTVLGALLAWAFSYVLPSWERRALPQAVTTALVALRTYAEHALRIDPDAAAVVEQRLSRQNAHDALEAVASAVRRSAFEPSRVRPPVDELLAFLDDAQRLMAHLSSVRLLLGRRRELLTGETVVSAVRAARTTLHDVLDVEGPGALAGPARHEQALALPSASPGQDLVPWFVRRVQSAVHDGGEVGTHARAALAALAAAAS